MVLGLFKKTPKLEATFTPTLAVARELAKEVEVNGDLVIKNVGKDVDLTDLEVVLIAGGTRRIDLELPAAWRGPQHLKAGGELRQTVAWKVKLAAPMRAPHGQIQLNTATGGNRAPLAHSNKFPLGNE